MRTPAWCTAPSVNDVTQAGALLHSEEEDAFGDAGYQGVHKRIEAQGRQWHVAMRPGLRRNLNPFIAPHLEVLSQETWKASVRAKVEHPFRVLKRQFGYTKDRCRGLAMNTAQIITLFALSNLWMARRRVMETRGCVRPQRPETGVRGAADAQKSASIARSIGSIRRCGLSRSSQRRQMRSASNCTDLP